MDSLSKSEVRNTLEQEWHTLHASCQRSEYLAMAIKLAALIVCIVAFSGLLQVPYSLFFVLLLLAVLWLQEAIWKTFQARTEQRLLAIETAWENADESAVLSFYSDWARSQRGVRALVKEYLSNALRPTVAYPYIIFLVISFGAGLSYS